VVPNPERLVYVAEQPHDDTLFLKVIKTTSSSSHFVQSFLLQGSVLRMLVHKPMMTIFRQRDDGGTKLSFIKSQITKNS
jgi:hypothetical protein